MDPQQRLLIETVEAALEDAGDATRRLDRERTSVFVGASVTTFKDVLTAGLRSAQMAAGAFGARADNDLAAAVRELVRDVPAPRAFTMTGTLLNMTAAAVAQTFGFGGPSFVIDAAGGGRTPVAPAAAGLRTDPPAAEPTRRGGRERQEHLLAVVAADQAQLRERLGLAAALLADARLTGPRLAPGVCYAARDPAVAPGPITFAYPGQGAQRVGILRDLYELFPVFRRRLDELDAVACAETGAGPVAALYPATGPASDQAARLAQTQVCQPAIAALSLALTDLLASVGVRPDRVLGHSLGEFCAAAAADVLTGEEAVRLVARRGAAMADLKLAEPGAMLAVSAGPAEVAPYLVGLSHVWIANVNAERQVVISGHASAVRAAREQLRQLGGGPARLAELLAGGAHSGGMAADDDLALGVDVGDPHVAESNEVRRDLGRPGRDGQHRSRLGKL